MKQEKNSDLPFMLNSGNPKQKRSSKSNQNDPKQKEMKQDIISPNISRQDQAARSPMGAGGIPPNMGGALNTQFLNSFLGPGNMYIQPNFPIPSAAPISNYMQIPVMIANTNQARGLGYVDASGSLNEQYANANGNMNMNMTGINGMNMNAMNGMSESFFNGGNPNMQKMYENGMFVQAGINPNSQNPNVPTNLNMGIGAFGGLSSQMAGGIASSYLGLFQEFENKMMNEIKGQNRILQSMKEDNDKTHESLGRIKAELNNLKESLKSINFSSLPSFEQRPDFNDNFDILQNLLSELTPDLLIKYVFNKSDEDFLFEIILDSNFPKILYKERYFNFKVALVNMNTRVKIANTDRISLDIAVYSYEKPPKIIQINNIGNKIVNWNAEKFLVNGEMEFEKVQIQEVSSHFRNGEVFIVVYPRGCFNCDDQPKIQCQTIKPLVFEKVIVRAKKLKTKLKKNLRQKVKDEFKIENKDK